MKSSVLDGGRNLVPKREGCDNNVGRALGTSDTSREARVPNWQTKADTQWPDFFRQTVCVGMV